MISVAPLILLTSVIVTTLLPAACLSAETSDARNASEAAPSSVPTVSLAGAVYKTIQTNPGVSIQQETVVQSEGLLQQAAGAFDLVGISKISVERTRVPLDQYAEKQAVVSKTYSNIAALPLDDYTKSTVKASDISTPDYLQTERKSYSIGLNMLTRYGVSISPTISATDTHDNSSGKAPQNFSNFNFNINVPLLRNFGRDGTGGEELARESALKSAKFTTRHNISQLINITAASFWSCLANQMSFDLTMDTQRRSQKILDLVEKLVKAGSLEPAALNQARANLLSNQVDVRGQQERLYVSRQALAVSMGLTADELQNAPNSVGTFPTVLLPEKLKSLDIQSYITTALSQRGDYLGAQTDIETATTLVRQAQNLVKPRLDLGLNAGYSGLSEDTNYSRYYKSLSDKMRGVNYLFTLSLELPIQNNAARGNLAVRRSQARVTEMTLKGMANRIASDTLVAYEGLKAAVHEYQLAEQAETAYRKAVEFENQKYMSGGASLTSVIDAEGRYFNARATRIEVLRKYATALADFRFVTGSLLDHREGLEQFDVNRLLEFPELNAGK